ncbi:cytochrome ubiquinol oxidase subunit II [Vibrio cyclitrophicus 1F175]|nr:cytochrome ubiquinol oxidase subunit II [Vibrio cyclitrophicus 1F53]OEF67547.1 cytochrome ubiquinol oxidase subunit II [Vibrio cyclitrophicus 1F175]PMH33444.1 cytochrome ubiquinol oxidase subunit II [Vibrio cyclitrophicus]PMH83039.1 cytochrome ubiquinol oxidase subunit II [Vibrio cyclitrophicus]
MLEGCNSALLDPKGSVGVQEKELIITALLLMLIVVIPVILMTIYFAYRYRESNTTEEYAPDWAHSTKIEVVSLDWKWLFIYPEQNIATVNYVAFPKDVPVTFKLTSDNIMNAFFIPRLGSQIYAMPGMVTKLNLIANHEGDFKGFASNYSGKGFSQMKFTASAMPDQVAFLNWVEKVKASPDRIEDWEQFRSLAAPSVAEPVTLFSSIPPFLFTDVVTQHPGSMNCLPETQG